MRLHLQSADYARTGKPARVQSAFVDVVLLLLPEIALDEKFACEVVVARERTDFTFRTRTWRLRVFDYHVPSRFELTQSGGWTDSGVPANLICLSNFLHRRSAQHG